MALMGIPMVWPLALLILRDGRTLVALDNAHRGRAELQQRHAEDMERKLADQAKELEAASEDRQATQAMLSNAQGMETLGQLTGGIAHDFNNLLMAISGNLQLLRHKLSKDMPEHRYVENAMTATEKGAMLHDFRPDVAVIDFLMPGMNGAEVARAAQKVHEGLPIVFVSGYSDAVALDQIADTVVLRKPFEISDLERALIAVLDLDVSQGLRFYNSGASPLAE